MSRNIILFDKEVPIREFYCTFKEKKEASEIPPYVNILVRLTNICQSKCDFCIYNGVDNVKFDFEKIKFILKEIKTKKIKLHKINITGGEPMIYPDLVSELSHYISENFPYAQIVLNTNGLYFDKIKYFSKNLTSIALSRMHYDDEKNFKIFKTDKIASRKQIMHNNFNDIMSLRCNLIKGQIDTREQALKYIDTFSKKIYYFGFVSLMKVNKFCEENYVSYDKLDLDNLPNSRISYYQSRTVEGIKICSCKNIVLQSPNGEIIKLYSKNNYMHEYYESLLVYDLNVLKIGFTDKIIF